MTEPNHPATEPVKWWQRPLARMVVLAVAVAVVVVAAWQRPREEYLRRPAAVSKVLALEPAAVAPGVYLLGKTLPAAAYLVETSEGLVLIDSGLEADADVVKNQIAELGFDVQRLRAILLTHVHADHCLGAEHLRGLSGAKVYAGRADCRPLREGGPPEMFLSNHHMPHITIHPTTVDRELAGGETIEFGEARFVALATPGHTPGSICYLLERPGLRALFTGDVVQCLSPAHKDNLGTYAAYLPPRYGGNARAFLASLRRLRALPLPDLILPGHPELDVVPQSPHLTAERWQALLNTGIVEMKKLLDRYRTDGANFLDGTPRELLPGLYYLGNLGPAAVYCLACPQGLFLIDAPAGSLLVDFLDQRFKQMGWAGRKPKAVLLTSADAEVTAGLAALVQRTRCQVVVPKAGLEEVRHLCPAWAEVLTEEDLEKSGWFTVRAIPLAGRGRAPVAYQLRWAGKVVLFSGRIPVKPSVPAREQLLRETGVARMDYVRSIDQLGESNPDLWLPAVPVQGQNANLYDRDWRIVLEQNRKMLR